MAVVARKNEEYYAPVTRVYSYSRAAEATNHGATAPRRHIEPEHKALPQKKTHAVPKPNPRLGHRVAAVFGISAVAAMLLFVVTRYSLIAEQYSQVNQLKENIEESNLNIAALDVKLQCVINLDDAREAAKRAGMGYPDADQIVKVGGAAADSGE